MKHASTGSTPNTSEQESEVFHILTGISSPFLPGLLRVPVKDRIWVTKTAQGNVCINEWIIQRTIGRGAYANVRLCHNPLTEQKAAMRMINRTSLRRKLLTQESADKFLWNCSRVMDFLTTAHPSILNLIEVMHHPIYADVCSVESSMESLIPGSIFGGQYAVTPGSLPPWVQAILSAAQQVNLICELSNKYRLVADQLSTTKGMLQPETISDLQSLLHNPMAINGIGKQPTQGTELTHRRMPSSGSKLKQYSAHGSQLDSNLTPRYQNTGRCTMNYDDNFVFIIEYCDGGTLQEVVRTADLTKIMITFYQVVDALCYMHFCNIVHQDIKLENVIITTDIKNNFKTSIPPASKLLPRNVPRTTDLFFTSTSGTIGDFVTGTVPSQSSTPLTSTVCSDASHGNPIESTMRRDVKDRYNIVSLPLNLPFQATISSVANQPPVMHRGPACMSSHLNDNALSPLLLPEGSKYKLRTLKQSSDIMYYLLGDSDTATYRAKISDFDTAIILEEEGTKLPTPDDVLVALKDIYNKHICLLRKRFTQLYNELVQQQLLPQESGSLLNLDTDTSVESNGSQHSFEEGAGLTSSISNFTSVMLIKESADICGEAGILSDLQNSSKIQSFPADTDALNGSIGVYRMSGIYGTQSLDISETVTDKVSSNQTNSLHSGLFLDPQNIISNTVGSSTGICATHIASSSKECPLTRTLQPSCFTLVLSLDDHQSSSLDVLEPCTAASLSDLDDKSYVKTSQEPPHNDAQSLHLDDLTPDGTGPVQKECKNQMPMDADIPADNSLLIPAIDRSIKSSTGSLPLRDTALLHTISRIEDFIQKTIETNKVGQELQVYMSSIKQINTSPAMPKSTYFINNSTGTPNILSPESRAVMQSCSDHNASKVRSLFSAVHADAWQTGVMLFHALTGSVRRTPLYRYSQEAFALCGTFGMLITDLLCGLLDEVPSHRYTLFECMYHPAVNPREFKLPMSIPAKGVSDTSMTTVHSVLSHAQSAVTNKSGSIHALWREAKADYQQLRRFHMLIILRRRQYILANNRSCVAANTIDNSMIYTCSDPLLLTNKLGLFSSKMLKQHTYNQMSHNFYHTDNSVAGERINSHANIIASEKLRTKTELCPKSRPKSPMSSSDILKHVSLNFGDSDGYTDTELLSDTESNTPLYITMPVSEKAQETKRSMGTRMVDQVFKHTNALLSHTAPLPINKIDHESITLMNEARGIKAMLEKILPTSVYERGSYSLPYKFPSPILHERTRNKMLLSIINSSVFLSDASSAKSFSSRRKHIFSYVKKLLKTYQRNLTLETSELSSASPLKISLSAPDLRGPLLADMEAGTSSFEHPLLDAYTSMRRGYNVVGSSSQGPEACTLDSVLSDSFENTLHALVNEENSLHVHNFDWFDKISPLDVYIGSSQSAIEYSLRLLHGQRYNTSSFFDLNDKENLSNITECSVLKDIIAKLKRMQAQNVIDGLSTLTVGSSFYELGTKLWYQVLARSFSDALGNDQDIDIECCLKDEAKRFRIGSLFPVVETQSYHHKFPTFDISAQSTSSSLSCSLSNSRASSPFDQLVADFSESHTSLSVPIKAISNCLTLNHPLSAKTFSGSRLEIQEISEIEHISMASAPAADRSQLKPKVFSQKLPTRTLPGKPLQISVLNISRNGIDSPVRNNKYTPDQSPRLEQAKVRPELSSPTTHGVDTGDISASSVMSHKSIDLSAYVKSGKEVGAADEHSDKFLGSALNDKYIQRNKLYNRVAVGKIFTNMEAQQKQTSLKERESSFEGGSLDIFREVATERRFLNRDELFTRSLSDCITVSRARKDLKDVGGLTSLFDDSVCTTVDDDNADDDQNGENGIISRNNSFHREINNDGEQRAISDIMLMRNKHQTRITGSFSRLRTTSTATTDNRYVMPSNQQQQSCSAALSACHCSVDDINNSTHGSPLNSSPDYKYLQNPPTNFQSIGHGTSNYMCCCCNCMRPDTDLQGFNAYRIQVLLSHFRFLYRYGCRMSWDPYGFTKRRSDFPKGLFLRRLRTLLIGRVSLPLHWMNASIQQELLRWNDFTMKGDSSTSVGTPAASDTKLPLRATSPRSPLIIPALNLQSISQESAEVKAPITRIRLVNQENDAPNTQTTDTSVRPMIPKLCFSNNSADHVPLKPEDNATEDSDMSSSSTSLHVNPEKKTSAIKINPNPTEAEGSTSTSDSPPATEAPDVPDMAQSAPLADLLAIQSTIPSTVHVNKDIGITSDDTSIGQCSTDSSDI